MQLKYKIEFKLRPYGKVNIAYQIQMHVTFNSHSVYEKALDAKLTRLPEKSNETKAGTKTVNATVHLSQEDKEALDDVKDVEGGCLL